ncbi:DUF3169 family protein [Chryseomicrobium sp. FSL W7-1435]|uniref:DUF3169 family protein n=1 Tax=Chryseomicrobium sp. FSL W7-1435 TaxID=2921704 RepID=UPI00315A2C68
MKKNLLKNGIFMILGAFTGFFITTYFLGDNPTFTFPDLADPFSVSLMIMTAVLLMFSVLGYLKIKHTASKTFTGDEEDLVESKMYRSYSDASLANLVAMVASLVGICISILTEQPIWLVLYFVVTLFSSAAVSFLFPSLMKLMYPERDLPSITDKDYAQKLLEKSDDGEKHVMLGGFYKSHQTTNSLLFASILLLLFYSMATGNSQVAGILIIAFALITINTQYMITIRNK